MVGGVVGGTETGGVVVGVEVGGLIGGGFTDGGVVAVAYLKSRGPKLWPARPFRCQLPSGSPHAGESSVATKVVVIVVSR